MRIVIINKSDATGGAAVVSRRLMDAFREGGTDARMLVVEKLSDSPFVEVAASKLSIFIRFVWERLKIFFANGFDKATLFKIDTGSDGLPLWRHPLVKEADAILLNWVNQGMLSLKGVKKLMATGKPVIWTMHDMWNMTGICHHAGEQNCNRFEKSCGDCPLLKNKHSLKDLSYKTWNKKDKTYTRNIPVFVAVSRWLADNAKRSLLLGDKKVEVIPNAFKLPPRQLSRKIKKENDKIKIVFGAARLDDPIKGLDKLIETAAVLKKDFPEIASRLEFVLFGNIKNPSLLVDFPLPMINLGTIHGDDNIERVYLDGDVLVSAASYENLPGTLVEAQAYGCIPVSFLRGGQADIISHKTTGYLAEYSADKKQAAKNLAEGIIWSAGILEDYDRFQEILLKMRENVENKFSYSAVTSKYLSLINQMESCHKT